MKAPVRGPLHGLRVVDAVQSPDALVASTFLADAGADVVVLELGASGHPARRAGPRKDGVSLLWKVTGRNKRAVRISPGRDDAGAWFDELLSAADVLFAEPACRGFGPGDDDSAGVHPGGPVELAARHPHLVVVTTSPFGAWGPMADHRGSGRLAEAYGGQTFAAGDPGRPPLHSGFPIGAAATALIGAFGALAAILERDLSGKGQWVDVAGYEAVLRSMEFLPVFFQQTGFRNERAGNGSSYQVPVATWLTADGKWVTFSGNTNDVVHRLYRAMGRPELIDDPRFATNEARVAHRDVVEKTLSDWAVSISRAELERACAEHNAPVGSVFTMADIYADANYRDRGTITEVADDELGTVRLPAGVPRFSGTAGPVANLGPGAAIVDPPVDAVWQDHGRERVTLARPAGPAHRGTGPLAGLRVIDMGQILAGPFAATLLADLGADVIKVEKPDGGDDFRRQAPLHRGVSMWWKVSARNKRSIALDLKDSADRQTFLDLVAAADIVTANFVPGTLERMGLGYDDLRAANPAIILVSVSGYGQEGAFRTRRAFGRNAEAYGGLASVTGYADGAPMPTGFPVADGFSAAFGAFGALCARYAQARSADGAGQHVDVALYETIFRILELPALVYDQLGEDPGRSSFGTAAGESICVAQSADGHWMSASRWGSGPVRFSATDPYGTTETESRRAELKAIRAHIEGHDADALCAFNSHPLGYSVAPIASIDELLTSLQCAARSSIVTVGDSELGDIPLAGVVPRFDRTPGAIVRTAPRLDEHRSEILAEWLTARSEGDTVAPTGRPQ